MFQTLHTAVVAPMKQCVYFLRRKVINSGARFKNKLQIFGSFAGEYKLGRMRGEKGKGWWEIDIYLGS